MVNKVACAGFEDISEFYRIKEAMIAREYNVDEIQMRTKCGVRLEIFPYNKK